MKHIIFEFIGGAWDGMNLSNRSTDAAEAALASYTSRATLDGCVGKTVAMPRQYAVGKGKCAYTVVHRIEVNGELLVRLESQNEGENDETCRSAKRIVLQFRGGCLDAQSLQSDAANVQDALIALAYYGLADRGRVGMVLQITPCVCNRIAQRSCAARPVAYQVVQRIEDPESLTLMLNHHL